VTEEKGYDIAITQGLKDYEDSYEDYPLETMLDEMEKLFNLRDRLNKLIYDMKRDLIVNYVERKGQSE